MNSLQPFLILICMLFNTVDSQLVSVVADNSSPKDGDNVVLTCNLAPFSLLASWINNSTSGVLTSCPPAGICTVPTSGRYNFSATNSTIVAKISNYATSDDFGWKCQHNTISHVFRFIPSTTAVTTTSSTSTTTTTTPTVTSSSTSISSTTVLPGVPIHNESTTINNTTSNKSKSISSDTDIKVIVPAVVVPCGLSIVGGIILVVCYVRRRTGKTVRESPDGMAIQDKGNNIEGWKQSQGHGKATDNLDTLYTTPDRFILYPGPAAMSTARSYKKHHDGTDQYNRPYAGPYHNQAEYFPSTYTSTRAYTHKDKKHYGVTDQYSRPYTGTYGYQARYVPSTYMSARTYPHKGRNSDYEGPIHQLMDPSRLAYDQTANGPQSGHYGQISQDVYYSGGGHYTYGQRSRSHYDHSGRKQQREDYNQYEMADYGGSRAGYRHTKQDMAFYY